MRLKRWLLVLLAGFILLALCACGEEESGRSYSSVSLEGVKVVVDPGHGDTDVGTIGVSTGRYEKEVNLEIGLKLKAALEQEGVTVVMTRESDDPVAAAEETDIGKRKEADMQKREQIIRDADADMYIGVHQNSFENADACGPQIFYYTDSGERKKLAESIQTVMNEELEIEAPRKVNFGRYRLLAPGSQPSVTVECGFFTNPEEEEKLQQEEYQDRVAAAIVDGIKYYQLECGNVK